MVITTPVKKIKPPVNIRITTVGAAWMFGFFFCYFYDNNLQFNSSTCWGDIL